MLAGLFFAVGVAYIGPVSAYLSQKSSLRAQELTLMSLQSKRAQLEGQLTQIQQPAVLETRAREIGMLRPGEAGFVINFVTPAARPTAAMTGNELLRRLTQHR